MKRRQRSLTVGAIDFTTRCRWIALSLCIVGRELRKIAMDNRVARGFIHLLLWHFEWLLTDLVFLQPSSYISYSTRMIRGPRPGRNVGRVATVLRKLGITALSGSYTVVATSLLILQC